MVFIYFNWYLSHDSVSEKIVVSSTRGELWFLLLLFAFCGTIRPFFNLNFPLYIFFFDPLVNGYFVYFLLGYLLGTGKKDKKLTYILGMMSVLFTIHNGFVTHQESSLDGIIMPFNNGFDLHHVMNASGLFLLCSLYSKTKLANIGHKFTNLLAKYSFSVYLVHAGVMEIMMVYFLRSASPIVSVLFLFTSTTVISYLLAIFYDIIASSLKKITRNGTICFRSE